MSINSKIEKTFFKDSSLIRRADYDPLLESLKIYFRNGNVYEFCGTPKELFHEMQQAESAGKFFHQNIKDKFDFFKHTFNDKRYKKT